MNDVRTEDFVFNRLITRDGLLLELPTNKDSMPRKIETTAGRSYEFEFEDLGHLIIPQTYKDIRLDMHSTVTIRVYRETASNKPFFEKLSQAFEAGRKGHVGWTNEAYIDFQDYLKVMGSLD